MTLLRIEIDRDTDERMRTEIDRRKRALDADRTITSYVLGAIRARLERERQSQQEQNTR